jgi:hypothetical protein
LDSPRREGTEGVQRREDGKARLSHNATACRALTRNQKNLEKAKESGEGKCGVAGGHPAQALNSAEVTPSS